MDCRSNYNRCHANCCRYLGYILEDPTKDKLRYLKMHEGVILTEHFGKVIVSIPCKCSNLKEDGSCAIYGTRPDVCKDAYQKDRMSVFHPNCIYPPLFISPVIKNRVNK